MLNRLGVFCESNEAVCRYATMIALVYGLVTFSIIFSNL